MERVGVLINKLQEQLQQNADVQNMLVTTQLLQKELMSYAGQENVNNNSKVSVFVPSLVGVSNSFTGNQEKYKPVPKPDPNPEPIQEPITEPTRPVPEQPPSPTPKPEPEPIPQFVEQSRHQVFAHKEERSSWALDPMMEVPTLSHQKTAYELNDSMISNGNSINERLKENKTEMASKLQEVPIRDLKRAISINDRHRFIQELFRGDETMYERSIKTINSFVIGAEAEFWIQRELKVKLGWNTNDELVTTFDQLVRRRFA
jgi:outer membrane biosynthesis protein TonB